MAIRVVRQTYFPKPTWVLTRMQWLSFGPTVSTPSTTYLLPGPSRSGAGRRDSPLTNWALFTPLTES